MNRQYKKLSAATVWTEIYSVIKGGVLASDSALGNVDCDKYIREAASSYLSGGERRSIFFAFLAYEKWK
jgi:hypothetical protein